MSKTLFWYVFRDLLRVFILTSLALAGIMSFGGLLKPLMKYGLSGTQVAKILAYFMPATQTYSLPIAALFATTVVYGRLAADNEIIACRASGISHLAMSLPAMILGLILSVVSLVCLSWVVPHYTLKVEKVAFDSLADVVKKSIDRTHQIKLPGMVIYADDAQILPPPADSPGDEAVALYGPMFARYEKDEKTRTPIPTDFFTARRAVALIRQNPDEVQFIASLEGGAVFPREFKGASLGGVGVAQFGPIPIDSPIRENTKFMNVQQLKRLYHDPLRSREISKLYLDITRAEQEQDFLEQMGKRLAAGGQYRLDGEGESYNVVLMPGAQVMPRGRGRLMVHSGNSPDARLVRVQRLREGQVSTTDNARQVTVKVFADTRTQRMHVELLLEDVLIGEGGGDAAMQGRSGRQSFPRSIWVAMPQAVAEINRRGPEFYQSNENVRNRTDDVRTLRRKLSVLRNGIEAEIHGRVAFAVSCLILVMIGSALGMMFRTGNYLSAFALSSIPALFSIALIVTGQHICENQGDALRLGLAVLWSGNVMVLGLVSGLMWRLSRT